MRTYITGFNGFLGRNLASRLGGFNAIKHQDIQTIVLEPFERFFFCSAYGNMIFHNDDAMVMKANVSDLISILSRTDLKKGFDSFVYISTSSVKRPHQTMYSRTKKASEEILLGIAEKYQLPICIIRPYSITGVGEQKEHLIPTLIRSCLFGEKINFVPEPRHDFIDVQDVVDGIMALSNRHAKGVFEIGSGKSYSNQEVLDIVEEVPGKKANMTLVENMRPYDTRQEDWVSTNPKVREFGWKPKKSLRLSIEEMVNAEQIRN